MAVSFRQTTQKELLKWHTCVYEAFYAWNPFVYGIHRSPRPSSNLRESTVASLACNLQRLKRVVRFQEITTEYLVQLQSFFFTRQTSKYISTKFLQNDIQKFKNLWIFNIWAVDIERAEIYEYSLHNQRKSGVGNTYKLKYYQNRERNLLSVAKFVKHAEA